MGFSELISMSSILLAMKKYFLLLLFGFCFLFLESCVKEPQVIPVTGISINPTSITLVEGEMADLIATVSPSNADNQRVIWASNDGSIASINNGKVTAIKPGSTIITAKSDDGGFTASCLVTVKYIDIISIILSRNDLILIEGERDILTATVKPDNATDKQVTWTSSNTSVARVDGSGSVEAISAGEAEITCMAKDVKATCRITVGGHGDNQPNNLIYYTGPYTIEPNRADGFGANFVSSEFRNNVGILVFDKDVSDIGVEAFYGKPIFSIEMPNSVSRIAAGAFQYSTLTSIIIPSGVQTIGSWAFSDCTNLHSVEILEGLKSIDNYAFTQCRNLTSIVLPDSLEDIGTDVFSGCASLQSIVIPPKVSRIRMITFWGCSSLKTIVLPEGLLYIDGSAFFQCDNLESIIIPERIKWILDRAFMGCRGLSSIEIHAVDPPQLGNDVFTDTGDCPIYVPKESVNIYRIAFGWSRYADRIRAIPEEEI